MDNELLKVLEAREHRWNTRKELAKSLHRSIITITLCVPLAFRTDKEYEEVFLYLCRSFFDDLVCSGHIANYEGTLEGADGPVFIISVDYDAELMKRVCVEAEETIPGGRLLDIDVMDENGTPISRNDIGIPQRKCFLCDNSASSCVSRRLHSPEEVADWVKHMKKQLHSKIKPAEKPGKSG